MFFVDFIERKKIVKSDLLEGVEHFFTTRETCLFSKEKDMTENRLMIEKHLKERLIFNQPVHGTNISKVVDGQYFYKESDGLMLDKKGAICMNFGDCTPLLFYCKGVVCISHAGWRGTVQKMAVKTVEKFKNDYGFDAKDIKVVIGPTICLNCYEVSKDVFDGLKATVSSYQNGFKMVDNKFFVGLKDINKQQLLESGVEMIDVCPYCTACGEKLFYSYRYENHTGFRHSAIIKL